MKSIGIDSCLKGWFLVSIDKNDNWDFSIFSNINLLWEEYQDSKLILIDMPIGLPCSESRLCDLEARKILKKRGSCVFPAPTRQAINASDYESACKSNQEILGKKVSKQAWNISPKIKQVDLLMQKCEKARDIIRESHPEICFWALAGGKVMSSNKKTEIGLQERLNVLQKLYPQSTNIFKSAVEHYKRIDLTKDDILDAIALAITATSSREMLCTLPEYPERDRKDLPMEIVYSTQPGQAKTLIWINHKRNHYGNQRNKTR